MSGIIEFILLVVFGFFKEPDITINSLEQMHNISIASSEGLAFNNILDSAIYDNHLTLNQCQYDHGNTAYITVSPSNQIHALYISDGNQLNTCKLNSPISMEGLPHSGNFVGKIML